MHHVAMHLSRCAAAFGERWRVTCSFFCAPCQLSKSNLKSMHFPFFTRWHVFMLSMCPTKSEPRDIFSSPVSLSIVRYLSPSRPPPQKKEACKFIHNDRVQAHRWRPVLISQLAKWRRIVSALRHKRLVRQVFQLMTILTSWKKGIIYKKILESYKCN